MERGQQGTRGGWLWLLQPLSGLLLVLLLALHIVANHFIVEGGLRTYQDVVTYLSNPLVFVLEVLFLLTVTLHAGLGVRSVLLDLGLSPTAERRVNLVLTLLGIVAVAYGVWLSLVIQGRA